MLNWIYNWIITLLPFWFALFPIGGVIGAHFRVFFQRDREYKINNKFYLLVYWFFNILIAPYVFGVLIGAFIHHNLRKEQDAQNCKSYTLIKEA